MRWSAVVAACCVVGAAWAQAPVRTPVREGQFERLILDAGEPSDIAAWVTAECTVTSDKTHVKWGPQALLLHIPIDWTAGEKNYPIGWPRIDRRVAQPLQDWSGYDYLEFSIYAGGSRKDLPRQPLGIILLGDGATLYSRELSELQIGQWVDVRIPLNALTKTKPVAGIKFYVTESRYKHGDTVDFWIDRVSLLRYAQPYLGDSRLVEQTLFGDARSLLVDVALLGVSSNEPQPVTWELQRANKPVASGEIKVGRGTTRCSLLLPGQALPSGSYVLKLICQGCSSPPMPLRIVASPWQEVKP
jgi:hypothetical protein